MTVTSDDADPSDDEKNDEGSNKKIEIKNKDKEGGSASDEKLDDTMMKESEIRVKPNDNDNEGQGQAKAYTDTTKEDKDEEIDKQKQSRGIKGKEVNRLDYEDFYYDEKGKKMMRVIATDEEARDLIAKYQGDIILAEGETEKYKK